MRSTQHIRPNFSGNCEHLEGRALRQRKQGFSLVEILTTLAILSIMAFVSMPALSFIKLGGVTSAGNQMADLAVLAQQYAVSHNQMTALVAVTGASAAPDAQYRTLVVVARDSSGNWTPVTKWARLPTGASISSASNDSFLNFNGTYTQAFPNLTYNGASVSGINNLAYQIFLPDGRMDTSSSTVTLRVVPTSNRGDANPQDWYDLVFNPITGTFIVNRP